MILFGLVLAFCGNKFITIVIGIMSALATIVLGVYFTSLLVDAAFDMKNVKNYAVWIILGIWAIIGIVAGVFIAKKRKWGIAIIGGFGGAMAGLLLTTVLGSLIASQVAFYAIVIGCAILAFLVAFKTEKVVLIAATAFIGSYFVIRGISMYAGGFPDET